MAWRSLRRALNHASRPRLAHRADQSGDPWCGQRFDNQDVADDPIPGNSFCRRGGYWHIVFQGEALPALKDSSGMGYTAALLYAPRKQISCLDLVGGRTKNPRANFLKSMGKGQAGNVTDYTALRAYRERLGESKRDLEKAEAQGDHAAVSRLTKEIERIKTELKTAVDQGGMLRKFDSPAGRARESVWHRIHDARKKIGNECIQGSGIPRFMVGVSGEMSPEG